jgi:hypothetical protein
MDVFHRIDGPSVVDGFSSRRSVLEERVTCFLTRGLGREGIDHPGMRRSPRTPAQWKEAPLQG